MSSTDIDTTTDSKEPKPMQFCDTVPTENGVRFVGKTDKQVIQTDTTLDLEVWR